MAGKWESLQVEDKEAAKDAWTKTVDWFSKHLKS